MRRFGHLCDNANDFSKITWRENPELTLKMILYPHCSSEENFGDMKSKSINVEINKNFLLKFLLHRAKKYQIYRGSVGFVYNFGFSLFRKFFLHLGKLLVENNLINSNEDIFYLNYEEIKNLSRRPSLKNKYNLIIKKRKRLMKEYQSLDLPEIIFNDLPLNLIKSFLFV